PTRHLPRQPPIPSRTRAASSAVEARVAVVSSEALLPPTAVSAAGWVARPCRAARKVEVSRLLVRKAAATAACSSVAATAAKAVAAASAAIAENAAVTGVVDGESL